MNLTVRDDNYKGKLLFPMIDFVLFGTDCHVGSLTGKIFLKDNIDGPFDTIPTYSR